MLCWNCCLGFLLFHDFLEENKQTNKQNPTEGFDCISTIDNLMLQALLLTCHVWLFCDPMDCSPSGSSLYGISQVRILEWVAISFSRGSSQFRDCTCAYIAGGFYITEPPGKPQLISIVINFPFFITVNILTLTRIVMYFCDLNQPQQSGSLVPSLPQRKRADATGVFPLTTFFLPQIRTDISNGSNFHVMPQT